MDTRAEPRLASAKTRRYSYNLFRELPMGTRMTRAGYLFRHRENYLVIMHLLRMDGSSLCLLLKVRGNWGSSRFMGPLLRFPRISPPKVPSISDLDI